jgi:alanine dehydrogenase
MLILSEKDLRRVLAMRDVIGAVEQGFRAIACGETLAPERLQMEIAAAGAVMLEMPGYVRAAGAAGALGTKIVSVFPNNAARALDTVQAVYLLFDSDTGVLLAMMEGRFITAIRTAATSAVATRFMARPDARRLAIFGTGVQAEFHAEAMLEVGRIESLMVVSRNAEKASEFAQRISSRFDVACDIATAEQAVTNSDLICTCTSSPDPLFDGRLLRAGAHINGVGAFTPTTRELDTEAVRRSRVIIDSVSAAGRESGEILIPLRQGLISAEHVKGSLADVVSGRVAGRESAREITLFKSCGLAIEDLVTARLAYSRAVAGRIGTSVQV